LPQPDGPSRVKNSPVSTDSVTSSTAANLPDAVPKRRVTLRISSKGMVAGAANGALARTGFQPVLCCECAAWATIRWGSSEPMTMPPIAASSP